MDIIQQKHSTNNRHSHNDYVVYFHRNPIKDNIIFYVGMGAPKRPFDMHGRNTIWKNYVKKYGKPVVEIYKSNLTMTEALHLETHFIKFYGRRRLDSNGILINMKYGSEGMSGYKHTEETRKKISKAFAGTNGINTGKKHPEAVRRNMSLAKKGKKWSEKQREEYENSSRKRPPKKTWEIVNGVKIGWGRYGQSNSVEARRKIGLANKGKVVSEEARRKMSETRKKIQTFSKKIIDVDSGMIYNSIGDAALAFNVNMKTLSNWLRNINPSKLPQLKYHNETI
jgi:hypothetical protein